MKELIEQIGGRAALQDLIDNPRMANCDETAFLASALLAVLDAQQSPVRGQARFKGGEWSSCTAEHAAMVMASPDEWAGYECRYLYATPPAASVPTAMQPLYIAGDGRIRFKENAIVRHLLTSAEKVGVDLNSIAMHDFSDEDRMQLAQLIGYSLGGYGELSYVSDESYDAAVAAAPAPGCDCE